MNDLAYGQNLIKQLGYRRTKDKAPRNEPAGTLYDTFFESRVHASKELSKRIDNTRSHQVTERLQKERTAKLNNFSASYEYGGTLLQNITNQREDDAPFVKQYE